jgi:hypothetical protein
MDMKVPIYEELQDAFDFYNKELFNTELSLCIIILSRKENSFGYFSPKMFVDPENKINYKHVIAMNFEFFGIRELDFTLSTLVHEMAHAYTFEKGVYGRGNYHNKWWAKKMWEIGLMPTDTGEEGGKETGQTVTHKIIRGGAFDKVTERLIAQGFKLPFVKNTLCRVIEFNIDEAKKEIEKIDKNTYKYHEDILKGTIVKISEEKVVLVEKEQKLNKSGRRYRYTCGKHTIWAKPGLHIFCEDCRKKMMGEEDDI